MTVLGVNIGNWKKDLEGINSSYMTVDAFFIQLSIKSETVLTVTRNCFLKVTFR